MGRENAETMEERFAKDEAQWFSKWAVLTGSISISINGNLLEIYILWAHPRPNELETLGLFPAICFFLTSPPGDSEAY